MTLVQTCPMCGQIHMMEVDKEAYSAWENREKLIQDAFPDLIPAEREFIKTGYCPACQSLLFGSAPDSSLIKAVCYA